jgi:tetratricopeptide (TPR) repeat protein
MINGELGKKFAQFLRSGSRDELDELVRLVLERHERSEPFREHVSSRLRQIDEAAGVALESGEFDTAAARVLIADEAGFSGWSDLIDTIEHRREDLYPPIFRYAIAAMRRGDFTALDDVLGGSEGFELNVRDWHERGYFASEPETLNEIFSAACMVGHESVAAYLLDNGVDPNAGMRTGLNGFHYAASSGRPQIIKLLIDRGVDPEVKNAFDGTVLGQALWSAVNEHTDRHAEVVELLVRSGAHVWPETLDWWNAQPVPSDTTRERVAAVLREHREFHGKLGLARERVAAAREAGDDATLADALRDLGNVERRPPFTRDAANKTYSEAADLYSKLGRPLDAAWVIRHIGINHEYAGRLDDAEAAYDRALGLYREFATEDDLNYANAVRYRAVVKDRLGRRQESEKLWSEAVERYERLGIVEGVVEGELHLARFALERGDIVGARRLLDKAHQGAAASNDPDTHKFVAETTRQVEEHERKLK